MKNILFLLFTTILMTACKKSATETAPIIGEIKINIDQHDVSLRLSKVLLQTDSISFDFATTQEYFCDRFRINYASQKNNNNHSIELGNIYNSGGYCTYGSFPATAQYQIAALPIGEYTFVVNKENKPYTGSLSVTTTAYRFNWEFDNVLNINPKVFTK